MSSEDSQSTPEDLFEWFSSRLPEKVDRKFYQDYIQLQREKKVSPHEAKEILQRVLTGRQEKKVREVTTEKVRQRKPKEVPLVNLDEMYWSEAEGIAPFVFYPDPAKPPARMYLTNDDLFSPSDDEKPEIVVVQDKPVQEVVLEVKPEPAIVVKSDQPLDEEAQKYVEALTGDYLSLNTWSKVLRSVVGMGEVKYLDIANTTGLTVDRVKHYLTFKYNPSFVVIKMGTDIVCADLAGGLGERVS